MSGPERGEKAAGALSPEWRAAVVIEGYRCDHECHQRDGGIPGAPWIDFTPMTHDGPCQECEPRRLIRGDVPAPVPSPEAVEEVCRRLEEAAKFRHKQAKHWRLWKECGWGNCRADRLAIEAVRRGRG